MARRKRNNPEFKVFGISSLGGNAVEATGTQYAPIRDASVQKVPLVYDARVDEYVSELAVMEMDDQDISLAKQEVFLAEEEFRAKAGYIKL